MNHLLPTAIKRDDSANGWSFTLYFMGTCIRRASSPLSIERVSLLLVMMDIAMIERNGCIMRPYERFRDVDGEYQLWSLDQMLHGNWLLFDKLLHANNGAIHLNADHEWMLDRTDYSSPEALQGSTSRSTDEVMSENLEKWFEMSDAELRDKARNYLGPLGSDWQSYGDLIPVMPGPDAILRDYLSESWSDRVAIDAAFRNI